MSTTRRTLLLCCLAQLMVTLDSSVLSVALPALKTDLGLSDSTLPWVVTAFAVPLAGLLLLSGRLADRYGARNVLTGGVTVFTAVSLVAGLAPTTTVLLAGRAGQGIGAALMSTSCLALLSQTFTTNPARARAFGLWAAAAGSGGAVGVLGGGVIVDLLSWRWTLLINVPIGVVLAVLILTVAAPPSPPNPPRLNPTASITFAVTAAAVVVGVASLAGHPPWWGTAWLWFPVAAITAAAFLITDARQPDPLVPWATLRDTGAWQPVLGMLFVGGAMTSVFYFTTLNLQVFHTLTALTTGIAFLPLSLGAFTAAAGAHQLQQRIGISPTITVGTAIVATALAAMWLVAAAPAPAALITTTGAFGIGMGITLASISDGTTQLLPAAHAGVASGILTTAQQLGSSVGLATTTVLDTTHPTAAHHTGLAAATALALLALLAISRRTHTTRTTAAASEHEPA